MIWKSLEKNDEKRLSLHHQGCINDYCLAFGTPFHLRACTLNKYNWIWQDLHKDSRSKDLVFHCLLVLFIYTCTVYWLLEFLCSNTCRSLLSLMYTSINIP